MRHAKSAGDTDAATDHDRPLSERGQRDAPRVASALAELGWSPELTVSSDSARTRQALTDPRSVRVWAYPKPTDLRQGYNGLFALVQSGLGRDPISGELFLFTNQDRTLSHVLVWDGHRHIVACVIHDPSTGRIVTCRPCNLCRDGMGDRLVI
jgi:hypothetical protein